MDKKNYEKMTIEEWKNELKKRQDDKTAICFFELFKQAREDELEILLVLMSKAKKHLEMLLEKKIVDFDSSVVEEANFWLNSIEHHIVWLNFRLGGSDM